jgi:hypothetical protein
MKWYDMMIIAVFERSSSDNEQCHLPVTLLTHILLFWKIAKEYKAASTFLPHSFAKKRMPCPLPS